MKIESGNLVFSPSDLVTFLASPYASWMDRYYLENRDATSPDPETEDQKLIAETGNRHERSILDGLKSSGLDLVEISGGDIMDARAHTLAAISARNPIIYHAALAADQFAGFADFMILNTSGHYQVWDTKLARSPKPYYAIQLCCYSEMFAASTGEAMPEKFGIILGTSEKVEFRIEDFIHYYRGIKNHFLDMQNAFTGNEQDRPEPLPGSDHGRWTSHAEKYFLETDNLVRVAGITIGQIKKLKSSGITTLTELANSSGMTVRKLAADSYEKLVAQARLQSETYSNRQSDPDASAQYELIAQNDARPSGLGALPPPNQADVFFDMEGYPLFPGGLEYLFGACTVDGTSRSIHFHDWWAHDRAEEKLAFEGFVDWVFARWVANPRMHIYHYAPYEVSAVRRLSTRHDTRQDEVDELLRHDVFVDLYKTVRQGLRIGEESYSIKKVERLYRPKRSTGVATAVESIVQYAQWMESGQSRAWNESSILKDIRDYNEDDCLSTLELLDWLRKAAVENGVEAVGSLPEPEVYEPKELSPEVLGRIEVAKKLRERDDEISVSLADLIDFHRREEKPIWWRMFDRANSPPETLLDDSGCIQGIELNGTPVPEKLSFVQTYRYDPSQECKLSAGEKSKVMFTHNLEAKFTLFDLDAAAGIVKLKLSKKALDEKFGGVFPETGSLIPDEFVSAKAIQTALAEVAESHLTGELPEAATNLFTRRPPSIVLLNDGETTVEAATRVAGSMSGGSLVVQGPPGTGKTFTASNVIASLIATGKKIGVVSNSHKAINNLLRACGEAAKEVGSELSGVKVGGDKDSALHFDNPAFAHVSDSGKALAAYTNGVIGGTAWLFTRPEWAEQLDFLFVDEAGQVSLANVIAMSRCTKNLVLLGDQMQLEQPIQGSHPGDAGLSALQYALKDLSDSRPDAPIFHAVVPPDYGLFLGESRRMHPAVCSFISESIYEGRLGSHPDCEQQKIAMAPSSTLITKEKGLVFIGVEHDGNIQQSDEEIERVRLIYEDLIGRDYTSSKGLTKPLALDDFLFIAPYNAQVRALQTALPEGARVGSVDKFQGQEAPVCILSLCSSYGEYGSRGLGFILDRNRINVAVSRAQCMAVIVADPRIASSSAGSIEDMRLINLFCKLASF